MPIKIPKNLPAAKLLETENIFIMTEDRAENQDIRPLKVAILNLMPNKEATENQILRMIANTPLQVEIVLLRMGTHESKNTKSEHLQEFYRTFDEIKRDKIKFDGLVITGAPVEQLEFEEVDYWQELQRILEWANKNVYSTLHICWAAQAGLYFNYNIKKHPVDKKVFGIYSHDVLYKNHPLLKGFDETFFAPHSRHTAIKNEDVLAHDDLLLLVNSEDAGAYIISSKDLRHVFVTGHGEYDINSLRDEYFRDVNRGLEIDIPVNYFPKDDPSRTPKLTWRAHSQLLFINWLNYCVYQQTPYNIDEIGE